MTVLLDPLPRQITWIPVAPALAPAGRPRRGQPGDCEPIVRSAAAIFIGSWVWLIVLGLLALAISAWVKWRPVAGFFLLLVYFGGAFFAQVFDALFHNQWGYVLDLHHTIQTDLGAALRHACAVLLQ